MLKKCIIALSAVLMFGLAQASADNIKAEIQYSPMNVNYACPCNSGTLSIPTFKLGLEGNVYRGLKLGLSYQGNLGEGNGNFHTGPLEMYNNTSVTDVSYSNFELNLKFPLDGKKWASNYTSSGARENNFYFNLGYKNNSLTTTFHPRGYASETRDMEKGNGIGFGLGYDGYFAGKWGFNAAVNYYPSMNSSAIYPFDTSYNSWVYRLGVSYDLNETFGVKVGYEGENHSYKDVDNTYVNYNGIVFGVNARW